MTLQLLHSEFPYIWGKFDCLFNQCAVYPLDWAKGHQTKEREKLRKFSFLLPRFPLLNLFHRVENPAYQFICEGRHVAEPRNHGNHSWLVPTARTKPSLLPRIFYDQARVVSLKGQSHAHFVFYLKASKLILQSKKVFLQKIFNIVIRNRNEYNIILGLFL